LNRIVLKRGLKWMDGRPALRGLVGLLVLAAAAPAEAQFSVSPVIVQIPATEADPVQLSVLNEGENAMQFRAYALDFDMSSAGQHTYWDHGSRASSCGDRLRIAPDAFTVPAGQAAAVAVSLAPGPLDRTCWSMVLVETSGSSEGSILVNQRIGVKLYGLSGISDIDGEVLDGTVTVDSAGLEVGFTVHNDGAWPLRPSGVVEIRDVHGTVVTSSRVDAFSVLPERERTVEVAVNHADLDPGRYLAVPILDFGADYLSGTQIDFRIEE
jgi:hypothetical protein